MAEERHLWHTFLGEMRSQINELLNQVRRENEQLAASDRVRLAAIEKTMEAHGEWIREARAEARQALACVDAMLHDTED